MRPTSHAPNKRATPLEEGWKHHLSAEFDQSYMSALKGFLLDEKKKENTSCHQEVRSLIVLTTRLFHR